MEIRFTKKARKQLRQIDKRMQMRIDEKIRIYAEQPSALANNVEALKGIGERCYRLRIGDYRVLFKLDDASENIMYIFHIAHRKEAYDG